MRALPLRQALPILLTLAMFLGWTVAGIAHHHADQPGCELCKAMHQGLADVPRPAGAPVPGLTQESIVPASATPLAERSILQTRERAPPSA